MTAKHKDVLVIDGIFYDTQGLARIHPGGEMAVQLWNCKDATAGFVSSHRRAFPHDRYAKYQIAKEDVDPASIPEEYTQNYDLYLQLCEEIKPIIKKTNGFAPWHYFLKVAFLLGVAFYFDIVALSRPRELWETVVQSLFCGFIDLNVQHDANHGAVSKHGIVNRIIGMSQDYIGGSSLGWMINHNTVHHVHCNDIERDGDLDIPLLRLRSNLSWYIPYAVQQLYFLVLEALFGPVHVISNMILIWSGPKGPQRAFSHHWDIQKLASFIPVVRLLCLMQHMTITDALFHAFVGYAIGGMYLAFFFIISHNFEGVKKDGVDSTAGCWVKNQTETSSNVGGWLLVQMNGGLNYQIEHHLFPRVHHSYYPYLGPVVRKFCDRHNIQYVHYNNIFQNVWATYKHMKEMGEKPKTA